MSSVPAAQLTVLAGRAEMAEARAQAIQAAAWQWQVAVQVNAVATRAKTVDWALLAAPHVLWVHSDVSAAQVAAALLRWRQAQPVAVLLDGDLPAGEAWACLLGAHDVLMTRRASVQQWLQSRAGEPLAGEGALPVPQLAQALRIALWGKGPAPGLCLQGATGKVEQGLQWLDSPHAQGWLKPDSAHAPFSVDTPEAEPPAGRDTMQMAATVVALAKGFVAADALTLGLSLDAAGQPCALPRLSWGVTPSFVEPVKSGPETAICWPEGPSLYAIVDTADRLRQCADGGAAIVQLRSKLPEQPTPRDREQLRQAIADSIAAAHRAGATLFINDHRQVALELGASGLHLGQEDLLALTELQRAALRQPRVPGAGGRLMAADWAAPGMHKASMQRLLLGISSHSVWELARARALAPDYVACGPVWATTTKDMPWIPQSLHNLRWWVAQAGCPVVAIGGILESEHIRQTAATGAAAVCVVRGLGEDPARTLPALQQALLQGHAQERPAVPRLPLPSLLSGAGVPDRGVVS